MAATRFLVVVSAALASLAFGCAPERAPLPSEPAALSGALSASNSTSVGLAPGGSDVARPRLAPLRQASSIDPKAMRDPFQASNEVPAPPPADARPRKARKFSVDQLKLVGLVTNTATPRAMLTDPTGRGWVVTQGELVGRAEDAGEGRFVSYRVDRIRGTDVVLTREDAAQSFVPGATRVISMPQPAALLNDD